MKGLLRRILRASATRSTLTALAAGYIRLVGRTNRWQVVGADVRDRLWSAGQPIVGCFWHNRMIAMPTLWSTDLPLSMLSSRNPDSQIIAQTIQRLGFTTIWGSSSRTGKRDRGGMQAVRAMVRAVREGSSVAITPDGPRGPRMRAGLGAVAVARFSGAPLLPVSLSVTRRFVVGSWDRMIVPLPFGRGVYVWGEPIVVPPDADEAEMERLRLLLEERLTQLSDEADRLCGQAPIAPAPPAAPQPVEESEPVKAAS
jgi:lysophospholipid acyltransferase (LPLAT)-like uncharacterized protein